jgi:hypothetical protein
MKRFLVVLIASFFLASAAYAAEETKEMKETKGAATKSEKAKESKAKSKSKSKSKSKAKDEKAKDEKAKEEKK